MIGLIALGILMLIWVLTWDEPGEAASPGHPGENKPA
jgi:hypothetical protein